MSPADRVFFAVKKKASIARSTSSEACPSTCITFRYAVQMPGTNPVDAGFRHLCHVPIPYISIRQEQEFSRHIARHVGHADDRQRTPVLLEIISSARYRTSRCQELCIITPEALTKLRVLRRRRFRWISHL